MTAERIERRLRRINAAISKAQRRAASLGVVLDHHADRALGAAIDAEASREEFILLARIAFRDPYRALKAWERHEWRTANLTLKAKDERDVVHRAHAAVTNSRSQGLELRGRRRFGREDGERIAAREALSEMADSRSNWLLALRRARTFSQARDSVGRDLHQMQSRLRGIQLRRSELLEELREERRILSTTDERAISSLDRKPEHPFAGLPGFVDTVSKLKTSRGRQMRLDRQAGRYVKAIHSRNAEENGSLPKVQSLARRLAACRVRRSELTAAIARATSPDRGDLKVSEALHADLKELHRAYGCFADGRSQTDRHGPDLSMHRDGPTGTLERRAARMEAAIERYRVSLALLSVPGSELPVSGVSGEGRKPHDQHGQKRSLALGRRRLALAELRLRDIREQLAVQTLSNRPFRDREAGLREAGAADRTARAERERRRLDRLYRRERRRNRGWELER